MRRDRQNGTNRQHRVTEESPTATLSVVLVSSAVTSIDRALVAVTAQSARFNAQLILVTRGALDGRAAHRVRELGVEVVRASDSCGRAEMCDLGMKRATGTIVAVRDMADVGEAGWLDAFAPVVPQTADPLVRKEATVAGEREVRNTMVAERRPRADQAVARDLVADLVLPRLAAAEMAAIM